MLGVYLKCEIEAWEMKDKLGEKEQGCEWLCRFRSEKDLNKSEEIEKANRKETKWDRGRLHGNEVLIRVSIMLDHKN